MDKLERLYSLLKQHPKLEEGLRLKAVIEAHPEWMEEYQKMLALQKRLVRETVDGKSEAAKTQLAIDRILEKLETTPAVLAYLDSLAELQEDFDAVAQILNQELNRQ
jgi:cell fate (sporulation/competence/biofilm development) regulator YmcA (YheA/YmcA/DUF963 family)